MPPKVHNCKQLGKVSKLDPETMDSVLGRFHMVCSFNMKDA